MLWTFWLWLWLCLECVNHYNSNGNKRMKKIYLLQCVSKCPRRHRYVKFLCVEEHLSTCLLPLSDTLSSTQTIHFWWWLFLLDLWNMWNINLDLYYFVKVFFNSSILIDIVRISSPIKHIIRLSTNYQQFIRKSRKVLHQNNVEICKLPRSTASVYSCAFW